MDCLAEGGDRIDIALHGIIPMTQAIYDGKIVVLVDDGRQCNNAAFTGYEGADSTVQCTLPPGRGTNLPVSVDNVLGYPITPPFPGVSYVRCPLGEAPQKGTTECSPCARGDFAAKGAVECSRCFDGTYSFAGAVECTPCPHAKGVRCPNGVLTPQHGHWAPAAWTDNPAPFAKNTTIFPCLVGGNVSCVAKDVSAHNGTLNPANAFACAHGHGGALCGACQPSFYFSGMRCLSCDAEWALSSETSAALTVLGVALVVSIVYKILLHKYGTQIKRHLHRMRRRYRRRRRSHRRVRRVRYGERPPKRPSLAERGEHWMLQLRTTVAQTVHTAIRATKRRSVGVSETFRILLNAFKVPVARFCRTHICRSSALQCHSYGPDSYSC